MEKPSTRRFVKAGDGPGQFVEITFAGGELEVVSGAVGSAGRAREHWFDTQAARDAFIEKRVKKALKDGFVEEAPPLDAPDPLDPSPIQGPGIAPAHVKTAWTPELRANDDRATISKYGGTPWLVHGESWPVCAQCTKPMSFVMQLRRDESPETTRWAYRADLIQVFVCDTPGRPGDPEWFCDRQFLVRHVVVSGSPAVLRESLPEAMLALRGRCHLERMVAHCENVGDEISAATFARALAEEQRVDAADYVVPQSMAEHTARRPLFFPAAAIVGWTPIEDVPASCDVSDEVLDVLEAQGKCVSFADKLGGFPAWFQDSQVPMCKACRAPMRFFGQIQSAGIVPVAIVGDGNGYVFVCGTCERTAMIAQR